MKAYCESCQNTPEEEDEFSAESSPNNIPRLQEEDLLSTKETTSLIEQTNYNLQSWAEAFLSLLIKVA